MKRTNEIIKNFFKINENNLLIGGLPVSEIVQQFPTPLYVYDFDILKHNYLRLRKRLTPEIKIFFSIKANPAFDICRKFSELKTGAEIASIGELKLALNSGFSPDNIIFAGPGKRPEELAAAVEKNILSINAESIEEIKCIDDLSKQYAKPVSVSIRINPKINVSGSHLQMGGGSSPFGIDEENLFEAIEILIKNKRLNFKGIHVYVGNQIFDYKLAIKNIKNILNIARGASKYIQASLPLVNFGGGFGIPYYKNEPFLDEKNFTKEINVIFKKATTESFFKKTTFIFELGRYLTAACGVFLTKILYIKESRGKRFAVVDGGMNYNSIATGNLGQKMKRKFLMCQPTRMIDIKTEEYDIVGPLCTPMDHFGRNYECSILKPGDIIAAMFVGAYGLTASPVLFLSHPCCLEVSIENNKIKKFIAKEGYRNASI